MEDKVKDGGFLAPYDPGGPDNSLAQGKVCCEVKELASK